MMVRQDHGKPDSGCTGRQAARKTCGMKEQGRQAQSDGGRDLRASDMRQGKLLELNDAQQKVASHNDGALMVSAGPGSGKTFVLVSKAISLKESGVDQSSILCMTFTEKATNEMSERLEKNGITGAKVCTFHAFSREVIEDNLIESGIGHKTRTFLRPLQIAWCLRNTDKFGLDPRYVKIGSDWNALYGAMLEAISRFKQEAVSHEKLQEFVDSRIASGRPGDADPEEMDDETKAAYRLNELNKVYRAYEEYKSEENFMDFEDIIYNAVALLKDDKDLLRKYQERFQYVMVDEFQDNNYSQLELVKLLGMHGNVTVVGDRDQSIMRFQGSYGRVFEDFQRTYQDREEIKLARNYRSTRNIIKIANQILGKAEGDSHGHTENEDGEKINLVFTDTDKAQAEYVARSIRDLLGSRVRRRDNTESPIRYRDVAVLTRRKAEGSKMAHELRLHGIPAVFVGNTDIRSNQVILDLVAHIRIMHSPETAGMDIFRILRNNRITEQNIATIYDAARRKSHDAGSDSRDDFVMRTMRECGRLEITQKMAISDIVRHLDDMAEESNGMGIGDLVLKVAGEDSDAYKKLLSKGDTGNIQVLNKFCGIAMEYQDVFPSHVLGDFLQYLPSLNQNGIETEDEEPEDAVNVMTMHKSKGKEFPVVFIPDVANRRFPTKYTERQFSIPGELRHGGKAGDSKEEHDEEERRLFYVSATRAMNRLFIMCPERYGQNVTASKPSRFLEDLEYETNPLISLVRFAGNDLDVAQAQDPKGDVAEMQRLASDAIYDMLPSVAVQRIVNIAYMEHCKRFGTADGFDPAGILDINMDEMVLPEDPKQDTFNHENITLSASSIKMYERCPLQFKFSKIMRIPTRKDAALDLGTVVHEIAEEFGKRKMNCQEYGLDDGMKMFRDMWSAKPYRGGISEDSTAERTKKMLDSYLRWDSESKNPMVSTEDKFSARICGVRFTGKIDRLEKNREGEYEFVDYKTGRNIPSKAKAMADSQLNIYAEAIRAKTGRLPARASLFYPELDKVVEYDITSESVKESMESISEVINEILKENFEATPGSACWQCGYSSICEEASTGIN